RIRGSPPHRILQPWTCRVPSGTPGRTRCLPDLLPRFILFVTMALLTTEHQQCAATAVGVALPASPHGLGDAVADQVETIDLPHASGFQESSDLVGLPAHLAADDLILALDQQVPADLDDASTPLGAVQDQIHAVQSLGWNNDSIASAQVWQGWSAVELVGRVIGHGVERLGPERQGSELPARVQGQLDLTRLEPIPPQPSLSRCGVQNSAADVPELVGVVDQLSVGGPAMDGRDHGRSSLSMSETTTPWESRS